MNRSEVIERNVELLKAARLLPQLSAAVRTRSCFPTPEEPRVRKITDMNDGIQAVKGGSEEMINVMSAGAEKLAAIFQ
ncbi:hypothetical protein SLA2020_094480 [Shorea laevis]